MPPYEPQEFTIKIRPTPGPQTGGAAAVEGPQAITYARVPVMSAVAAPTRSRGMRRKSPPCLRNTSPADADTKHT